jgi:hypothetical protein
VPAFHLGEDDAHGYHPDAKRERHDGVACLMTANPCGNRSGILIFRPTICVKTPFR